jgi:uncharacterized protein (TIGR00288 family)
MAVFCDFENVARGVRDAKYARFNMKKVLERLLLKGNIVVKKAYCDWERFKEFKAAMHEASFELIEIPHVRQSGKNSADIRMVVDALDLCYTKSHVDAFVIVSGDSDFSPLVSKLRENDKVVIGVGVKESTSDLLIANCDEFIYYDDLVREEEKARAKGKEPKEKPAREKVAKAKAPAVKAEEEKADKEKEAKEKPKRGAGRRRSKKGAEPEPVAEAEVEAGPVPEAVAEPAAEGSAEEKGPEDEASEQDHATRKREEAIELVMATVEDLFADRGDEDKVWGSMVKQTLKRRRPGFNERYHGFRTFGQLLEEAQARGLLALEADEKSGGYRIRRVVAGT